MKNSASVLNGDQPKLIVEAQKVLFVSDSFCELTGYTKNEVLGGCIGDILSLLRLSHDAGSRLTAEGRAECYLFTKELEPREILAACICRQDGSYVYTFSEKPNSRLEEVLPYPCQLLEENVVGMSIYSAPDITLLKANQTYLNFGDEAYRYPEKTIGRTLYEFIEGYRGSETEKVISEICITGKSVVLKEHPVDIFKRGTTYWDQLITPVKVDGKIKYIVTNTQEATERVLAGKENDERKKQLEQREAQLSAVFENMTDVLVIIDRNGRYVAYNKAARELFAPLLSDVNGTWNGLKTTQLYDGSGNLLKPGDDPIRRVMRGEHLTNFRIVIKKDSFIAHMDINGTPVYDEKGAFIAGIISGRDVTAQVNSEMLYTSLFKTMPSGVIQYDAAGTVLSMNPAAASISGQLPEDFVGSSIKEPRLTLKGNGTVFRPEEYPVSIALKTGKPVQDITAGIYNPVMKECRWISINAVPLFRPGDTKPYQVFSVFDDITEYKKARDALKKSESILRSVLDNSGDFVYSLNVRTNTYEYVSPSSKNVLDVPSEEFKTIDPETFHAMIHPDDRAAVQAALVRLEHNNETELHYRQRMKDGEYRWFVNSMSVVKDENGSILYRNGRIHDITKQKKTEETIARQNMILKTINEFYEKSFEFDGFQELGAYYMKIIEAMTGSKFSFIIEYGSDGLLHDLIADGNTTHILSMAQRTGVFEAPAGTMIKELRGLLESGESLMVNDPSVYMRMLKMPENHPELTSFLCIPYVREGRLLGLIGAANRDGGYTSGDLELLEAFTPTIIEVLLRKRISAQLSEAKAQAEYHAKQLEAVIENMHDALAVYDRNREIVLLNAQARRLYPNLDHQMHVDKVYNNLQCFDLKNRPIPTDKLPSRRVFKGEVVRNEMIIIRSPEAVRYIEINATPVFEADGQLAFAAVSHHDVTDMMEKQQQIMQQNVLLDRQSKLLDLSNEAIFACIFGGAVFYWNDGAEKLYGYTRQEALGRNSLELLKTRYPDGIDIEQVLAAERAWSGEIEQTTKDGRILNIETNHQLFEDENGQQIVLESNRNITERIKMENALRENELHLRLAAEGAKLGTYDYDFINGTRYASPELRALWGLQPGEPVAVDSDLFLLGLHPDDKKVLQEKIAASNDPNGEGQLEVDYRIIMPDGAEKWLHMRGMTMFREIGGRRRPVFASGVVIDITERVAAENSVRELSEELRNIIESTDDHIGSVDRDFRLILFNSAFSGYMAYRFRCRLRKGAKLEELIPQQYAAIWNDLFERTVTEGKYQIELKIDEGARVMSYSFNPVYIDGKLVEITVFGRDITERINSEREIIRLNASLEKRVMDRTYELQKSVSDLQNFSRILSHDLKEPIRQIEYYTGLIREKSKNDAIRPEIDEIGNTSTRMLRLIESLSKYAKSAEQRVRKEKVYVKKILTSIFNELKKTAPNDAILQFETGLPGVYADKVLMEHVLFNLLSNALKFSSKREVSVITAGCMEENLQYVFYIRDNGVGFDMKYVHKLFNVFERLHADESYEGTGIGLASVRNIIRRHGGNTWIESQEGIGTTVYFSLPASEG